jgi:C4-dicarboxylate-specific signal transduction histidine kinase
MRRDSTFLLKGLNREFEDKTFEINPQILFGRSRKCDVLLNDGLVSRKHTLFEVKEDQVFLTDLNSRNGTYLNQERVQETVKLTMGDLVRIGRSEFQILPNSQPSKPLEVVDDSNNTFAEFIIRKSLPIGNAQITDSFLVHERRLPRDTHSLNDIAPTAINLRKDKRPQWFEVLFQISREIQTKSDAKEMSEVISDLLLQVLDGDRCLVALFNESNELELHSVRQSKNKSGMVVVKLSQTVTQQVIEEKVALNINDIRQDKRFEESDSLLLSEICSLLVAPILIGNRVLGLIEISRNDTINAFNEAGLELLSVAASMLGAALNHFDQSRKQDEQIQELEETQLQLRNAQEDLLKNQQLAIVGRMASSINHEIGNLLMPLLEYHGSDEMDSSDDGFELFTSEELAYSCTQIKSLIEDIKSFSKGANRIPEMSRCDLSEQVEKAVRFVTIDQELFPQKGPKKLKLELEISARPRVIMDPLQIGRVIINLLRNSAQAVRSQNTSSVIRVRVREANGLAWVEVEDNGPGIPVEIRDSLFNPFVSTKGDQGLGLGLDISRRIIHNHKGTLDCDLERKKGALFRIKLPFNPTIREKKLDGLSAVFTPTVSEETL